MARPNVRHRVAEVRDVAVLPRCDAWSPWLCRLNAAPDRERKLVYLEVATGRHFCHRHLPCGPSLLIEFNFKRGAKP